MSDKDSVWKEAIKVYFEVISLAILADPSVNFRPTRYEVSRWGFLDSYTHLSVILSDLW